jgi:hypothetical protein
LLVVFFFALLSLSNSEGKEERNEMT